MEWAARESRSRELMEREENSDMPTVNLIPFTIHYSNITSFYLLHNHGYKNKEYVGVPSIFGLLLTMIPKSSPLQPLPMIPLSPAHNNSMFPATTFCSLLSCLNSDGLVIAGHLQRWVQAVSRL